MNTTTPNNQASKQNRTTPASVNGTTFHLRRFLAGLMLTALGVMSILLVGVSLIHVRRVGTEMALPIVGVAVLIGIMLLGGGFGLMATASAMPTDGDDVFGASLLADTNPEKAELDVTFGSDVERSADIMPSHEYLNFEDQSCQTPNAAASTTSSAPSPVISCEG
ncbi:MAG: hypothetical protein KDA91_15155 [Planctomycetaceae bacterium]|nr:hypothetical protein [Planctomycetaceae bacterium]